MKWQAEYPQQLLAKLGPKEKAFLQQFEAEYCDARFGPSALHSTQEAKRERYRAQNAAYRDVYARARREEATE